MLELKEQVAKKDLQFQTTHLALQEKEFMLAQLKDEQASLERRAQSAEEKLQAALSKAAELEQASASEPHPNTEIAIARRLSIACVNAKARRANRGVIRSESVTRITVRSRASIRSLNARFSLLGR